MKWLLSYRVVNQTWLINLWCAGVLVGIAVVQMGFRAESYLILLIGLLLVPMLFKRTRLTLLLALISGLLVGNWQGTKTSFALESLQNYFGQTVKINGVISDDPTYGTHQQLEFLVGKVSVNGQSVPGQVKVAIADGPSLQRGDYIEVQGKINKGFGNYQARVGFAKLGHHTKSDQPALQLRDSFAGGVKQTMPEPQASLGLGFLLGQRSALPKNLDDNMRRVGLTHIVVASGYNLTILVRAARRWLAPISKFQAMAGSLGLIAGFVIVTGFSPSMTRAALVTVLSLWAWYYGRRIHPLVLILFAAAITGLINPLFIWYDLGWHLSFLAFAGVLLLAPLLTQRLLGVKELSLMQQVGVETICAQIMTIPLILWAFGQFSVFALLANILVVPLIPLTMLATFAAGIAALGLPFLAGLAGLPATLLASYMTSVTNWLASVPWAVIETSLTSWAMVAMYLAVGLFGLLVWRRTNYDLLQSSITD